MMTITKFLPLGIIVVLSVIAYIFDLHHYLSFDKIKPHQKLLEDFVAHNWILSILIYMALYISIVAFSIPAATFMTLVGGFLFGQAMGTSIVVISATLGACILFVTAKMASSDFLTERIGGFAKTMQQGFQENALSYLLTLRLIPIFPFIAVNLAAALFQIPLKTFILGTFFGIMPGSFVYVSMGVALQKVIQNPDFSATIVLDPKILIAFVGLGILSLLPALYKRFKPK